MESALTSNTRISSKICLFALMGKLIVHPDTNEKLTALKAVMRVLNISFEEEEAPYNPKFVAKVKKSQADFKAGRYEVIETEDLWK